MKTSTKVILGVAGLAAVSTAIVFYPKKAKAGQPGPGPGGGMPSVTKDSEADLIKACVDGTKAGGADGTKDGSSGGSKSPLPISNYSEKKAVQAKYEECYGSSYSKMFDTAKAIADIKKAGTTKNSKGETVPYGTGPSEADKSAAFLSGKDAGKAQARLDTTYVIDYSRVPAGYRTEPFDPVLKEQWRAGYNEGYGTTWTAPPTEPYGSGSSEPEPEDDSGIFGEYVRVGGRIVPRTRVGAMYLSKSKAAARGPTSTAPRKKLSGGPDWDAGYARGCADAKRVAGRYLNRAVQPAIPPGFSAGWSAGYMAGWTECASLSIAVSDFEVTPRGEGPRTSVGAMYLSKSAAPRRKLGSASKWYDAGFAAGIADCKKWISMGAPKVTPPGFGTHGGRPTGNQADDKAWYDGWQAGWEKCQRETLLPGKPLVIQAVNFQPAVPGVQRVGQSMIERGREHGSGPAHHAMRALSYASRPVIAPLKFLGGMVHGIVSGVIR